MNVYYQLIIDYQRHPCLLAVSLVICHQEHHIHPRCSQESSMAKKNPKHPWRNSRAKKLLKAALVSKEIPLSSKDMPPRQVFEHFRDLPAFQKHDFNVQKKFASRLYTLRNKVQEDLIKASADAVTLSNSRRKNPKKTYWNETTAYKLLSQDMDEGKHQQMAPRILWETRPEYQLLSKETFRKAIHAEVYRRKSVHKKKSNSDEEEEEEEDAAEDDAEGDDSDSDSEDEGATDDEDDSSDVAVVEVINVN